MDPVRSQYPASFPCHFTSTSHSRVSFQATMVRTKECLNSSSPQYHQVHFTPSVRNAEDTTQRPRSARNKPQNRIKKPHAPLEAAPTADKSSSSWVCLTPMSNKRPLAQTREPPRRPSRINNSVTRQGAKVRPLTKDLIDAAP